MPLLPPFLCHSEEHRDEESVPPFPCHSEEHRDEESVPPFPCHSEEHSDEESVLPLEYGSFDSGFASTQDDSVLNFPVIGEEHRAGMLPPLSKGGGTALPCRGDSAPPFPCHSDWGILPSSAVSVPSCRACTRVLSRAFFISRVNASATKVK